MVKSAMTPRRVALVILILLLMIAAGLAARQIGAASPATPHVRLRTSWLGLAAPISTTLPSPIATGTAPLPTPVGTLPPTVGTTATVTAPPATTATAPPATATAPPPGTPGARLPSRTTLCVSLAQDPDTAVPAGGGFSYTLTVANSGSPGVVSVRIPLDPNVEILNFQSTSGGSFVDYLGTDAVSVVFSGLDGGSTGKARISARVRATAATGSHIVSRAQANWSNDGNNASMLSNSVTITVGPQADTGKHGVQQTLQGAPTAPIAAGTPVILGGTFFGQEEQVSLWVNLPNGQVATLDDSLELADQDGALVIGLSTTGAASGTYSLVAHGLCTNVEGVGVFTIR